MPRPRLFYILGSIEANDTGEELITILGRLSRAQFEPRVVALGGREDLQGRIVEMKVRSYPLGLSGVIGTLRAIPKVRSLLKQMGAEVVHGFGSWGGAVARLAAPKGVAVVRTVTRAPTHHNDLRGRVLRYLERRARRKIGTRFIVPNEGSRGLALRSYGAADSHVTVLPTSVDVSGVRDAVKRNGRRHAQVLLGIEPDETAVVLLTNFESSARMDNVLRGFLTAWMEQPKLRLFIVGSGPAREFYAVEGRGAASRRFGHLSGAGYRLWADLGRRRPGHRRDTALELVSNGARGDRSRRPDGEATGRYVGMAGCPR